MTTHSIISCTSDKYDETSAVLCMERCTDEDVKIYYNPRGDAVAPASHIIWTNACDELAISLFYLYISNVRYYRPKVCAIRQIDDLTPTIPEYDIGIQS